VSDISALRGLTQLQSLDLQGTQVSDISALRGLMQLQSLTLGFTRVSDISALRGLILLRELDLTGTPITAEAVARLRESLAAGGNRGVRIAGGGISTAAVDNLYLAGRAWLRSLWPF
jgi:Leucine-rich repeat (LRR) protein